MSASFPPAARAADGDQIPAAEPTSPDPRLFGAVELALQAAQQEAGAEQVGQHIDTVAEDGAATHLFDSGLPGYRGWRWAVTVATAGGDSPITVSEVVLLPGPDALTGAKWVPWLDRVKAGDLGVGDLLPPGVDDPRLVPGYLGSDDPAVEEVVRDVGLGRVRVLSRYGREEATRRWQSGEFGPRSDMARGAPATCGTCGFYLPLAGSLRAAFGACGNEIAPADGHVVHAEYGCGAHSEAEVDLVPPVPVTGLVYDDAQLDIEAAADVDAEPEVRATAREADTGNAGAGESAVEPAAETAAAEEFPAEPPGE